MQIYHATTPVGRRQLSLAHVAGGIAARERPADASVNKWAVFRDLCLAKDYLGVSERALAVLDALLTFFPEDDLGGDRLTVFPSNVQLSLRAHGMAAATLRRHLAGLVEAGLIVRRDSPNGKRYARKGQSGGIEEAFGFDLAPLVTRAGEIAALAERVRAEQRAFRRLRETISICRRDIGKMIETARSEGVPLTAPLAGQASWDAVWTLFRGVVEAIPRTPTLVDLEMAAEVLRPLAADILNRLENHVKDENKYANESQSERHKQNSNPNLLFESEPALKKTGHEADVVPDGHTMSRMGGEAGEPVAASADKMPGLPLGLVVKACPDIVAYAPDGIGSWADLVATAARVRPMLGISPDAWREASEGMGLAEAAVTVATIVQRIAAIRSPGGYLRSLTLRARAGTYSTGPIIMALLRLAVADDRKSA